jgi:hypothetical protein
LSEAHNMIHKFTDSDMENILNNIRRC